MNPRDQVPVFEPVNTLSLAWTLLDQLPVGVAVLDAACRYQLINTHLAAMNGFSVSEHLGRTIEELLPNPDPVVRDCFNRALAGETVSTSLSGETPKEPGSIRQWNATYFPVAPQDKIVGVGIIAEEVTRVHAAERRAELAASVLTRQNRFMQHVAAMIAHDLRSPVTTATLKLDMLRTRVDDPEIGEEITDTLSVLHAASTMINALLKITKLQSIDRAELVELTPLVERVWASIHEAFGSSQASLDIKAPLAPVMGDEELLMHLFQNLMENSLKHSRPGVPAKVTIATERHASTVRVFISDNGAGIAADDVERLRRPFSKSPLSTGLGLGLVISDRIIDLHCGDLKIEPNPDHGVTATFSLPAASSQRIGKPMQPTSLSAR